MNYHKDYKLASQNVYNTCTALFLKMTKVFLKVTAVYLSTRGSCGHLLAFASTGITRDGAFVTKFTALIFVFHPSAISVFPLHVFEAVDIRTDSSWILNVGSTVIPVGFNVGSKVSSQIFKRPIKES